MLFIDSLLSVIAPHNCLACGREGSLLCSLCASNLPELVHMVCYRCSIASALGMICETCHIDSPLRAIRARTLYSGVSKELVRQLKFERAVGAARPMAHAMTELVPQGLRNVLICPVPTATSRIRARGYDQSAVLARLIAQKRQLTYRSLLCRTTQTRQLGASRQERRAQLSNTFYVRRKRLCQNATIILVDDVMTTGSSLHEAAAVLRAAGAFRVFGLVFAYQPAPNISAETMRV